uniref:Uncharacterized protein n=1 Tax=Arion vulgaris TaxID=1028688 RepID=A0A0B6Z756_9EUPU
MNARTMTPSVSTNLHTNLVGRPSLKIDSLELSRTRHKVMSCLFSVALPHIKSCIEITSYEKLGPDHQKVSQENPSCLKYKVCPHRQIYTYLIKDCYWYSL